MENRVENEFKSQPRHLLITSVKNFRKKLAQEGKQDILLQHSQRQLELQQAMMEGLTRKDDGLEAAMRSMAESSALLNKTLATGLQFMFSAMQRPRNIGYQSSNPPGFTANNWVNQSQFPPLLPQHTHVSHPGTYRKAQF